MSHAHIFSAATTPTQRLAARIVALEQRTRDLEGSRTKTSTSPGDPLTGGTPPKVGTTHLNHSSHSMWVWTGTGWQTADINRKVVYLPSQIDASFFARPGPSISINVPPNAFLAVNASLEFKSGFAGVYANVYLVIEGIAVVVMQQSTTGWDWRATAPANPYYGGAPPGDFFAYRPDTPGLKTVELAFESSNTNYAMSARSRKLMAAVL